MKKITVVIPLGKNRDFESSKSIEKHEKEVDFLVEKGLNPSRNRNKGIKKAKTEFIAFINGHTVLSNNWAKEVVKFFLNYPEIDIVGGPQLNYKEDNFFANTSGYALASIFGSAKISQRYGGKKLNLEADETQLTSANLICRKKVFKSVKFDENIYPGEDPKFISDSKKAGFKVAYSPKIVVYNRRRENILALIKQIFNYGIVRPKKESLLETAKRPFFLVPSIFLIYLAFLAAYMLSSQIITGGGINISGVDLKILNFWLLSPLLLYLILNLSFSLANAIKKKSAPAFFILPFIYLAIHISYGAGFLVSLANKMFKRGK